jgi:membrane protein implicated in regulation of membrane protease activity
VGFLPIISVESALVLVSMAAIVGGSFYVAAALCVIAAVLQSQWPVAGQFFSFLVIAPLFFWLGWKHLPPRGGS